MSREAEFLRKIKRGTRSPEVSQTGVWTDYSTTSTITGWSSFTVRGIKYKKIGRLVFVSFALVGTSNGTAAAFLLPFVSASGMTLYIPLGRAMNNSVYLDTGMLVLGNGSNSANCYINMNGNLWTASGTKFVAGQFFYEASS